MTTDVKLLPCPFCGGGAAVETYVVEAQVVCLSCRAKIVRQHGARDVNGLPEAIAAWNARTHATAAKDAENERLRGDKLDLEAALEYLKSHKEIAVMNQIGVIKALTEIRDEQGAEIHRLRAELEIEKGQAEFYRITRNWSQQKAERLADALREVDDYLAEREDVIDGDDGAPEANDEMRLRRVVNAALDQEGGNG